MLGMASFNGRDLVLVLTSSSIHTIQWRQPTKTGGSSMWTVVYIAPTMSAAEKLRQLLTGEGLLVNLKTVELDDEGRGSIEVQVPEGEAEEAHEIITQHLGRIR